MPHEAQRPAEIERDLARERDQLAETLEDLRDRLSFEGAWKRAGRHLRENGSDYGQSFGNMIREKPLAVALTTIGLTWLIFGPGSRSSSEPTNRDRHWQPRTVDADPDGAMPAPGRAARTSTSSAHGTGTGDGTNRYASERSATSHAAVQDTSRPAGVPSGAVGTQSGAPHDDTRRDMPAARTAFQTEREDLSKPSASARTASGRPDEGTGDHESDRNEANS